MPDRIEGRWTTWTDDQGQSHIARIDVPGNQDLEALWASGTPRRPTPEELQRAIQWTSENPDWQQEAEQEMEDIGRGRYEEGDTGTPEQSLEAPPQVPQGPRFYVDSRTGQIMQADRSPDAQFWWRLIPEDANQPEEEMNRRVEASLAEGEPAMIVPLDFTSLPPGEQTRIAVEAIEEQYGEADTGEGEVKGVEGRFRRRLLELQREWGMSAPQSELQTGVRVAEASSGQPLSPEETGAIQDIEGAESRWRFNSDPSISPFNQGQWPSEEEQARRHEQVIEQMRRMKRERPDLYRRLPLLHGLGSGGIRLVGSDPSQSFLNPPEGETGLYAASPDRLGITQGIMPGPPGGSLSRWIPSGGQGSMNLKRALDILGIPLQAKGAAGRYGGGLGASRRLPYEERIIGGPEYLERSVEDAYRVAARAAHPDVGGDTALMQRVNAARDYVIQWLKYRGYAKGAALDTDTGVRLAEEDLPGAGPVLGGGVSGDIQLAADVGPRQTGEQKNRLRVLPDGTITDNPLVDDLNARGRREPLVPRRWPPVTPGQGLPPEPGDPTLYRPVIPGTTDWPMMPIVPRGIDRNSIPTFQPATWPQVTLGSPDATGIAG